MHENRVASRYAKSLLDLSLEKGILDPVSKDMQFFSKLCDENPALARALKNPIVSHDKKLNILTQLLKGKVNDITFSIFQLISRKNREGYLPFIAKEFTEQYKKVKGIETAEVTTTFSLTDAQRTSFIHLITNATGKQVDLKEKIDKDIIGGFVLKVGDRMVDQSVRTKLQKLRNNFNDNSYIAKY